MISKATKFRQLLASEDLEFICQAHDGLSAKIAEETGFAGIWASGLGISAALGVRDSNEASWTQVLEVIEFMSDATTAPILLDGDTGYGNFNNLRRLVKKLESRDIAGVCIEDKLFPKTNSFINGEGQALADIDEFCGKIKAGKDTQLNDDFSIVARTEAFIVGAGLEQALHRAEQYRLAGADAILVHSKKNTDQEIQAFMKEWDNRCPIVIVPTTYFSTPTQNFRDYGISMVIWANQLIRASVQAMQACAKNIFDHQSLHHVEDDIVSVKEIFRLQGAEELQLAEEKYLPGDQKSIRSIVLAASRGQALGELTKNTPKALLPINGKPILERYIDEMESLKINDVSVVRGYLKHLFNDPRYSRYDNDEHETTGELYSLYQAKEKIHGDCIISYGDCLYRRYILEQLINSEDPITLAVDSRSTAKASGGDMAYCDGSRLVKVQQQSAGDGASGEWIGIVMLNESGSTLLRAKLDVLAQRADFATLSMNDLLNELTAEQEINVIFIEDGWLNVNETNDLLSTSEFR